MTQSAVYLDHNATSPVRPEVVATVAEALTELGNPSSVHALGRKARTVVDAVRSDLAHWIGAKPEELIFTSGGTEANNLALDGPMRADLIDCFVISGIEHDSVRAPAHGLAEMGLPVFTVPVTRAGAVDLGALEEIMKECAAHGNRPLVSVMIANNETGVLQPVREIVSIVRTHTDGLVHTDAVQGLAKLDWSVKVLDVDLATVSAHKIGGPAGVGALYVREGLAFTPSARGGGQELGRRSGTENVSGIAGFGAAIKVTRENGGLTTQIAALRDWLEDAVSGLVPEAEVYGKTAPRLVNTSCIGVPGLSAETQVMALDLAGIAVSAGAACSSGKVTSSHVLEAMGVDPSRASSAIRVSLGWNTTQADIDRFVDAWADHVRRTRREQQKRMPEAVS